MLPLQFIAKLIKIIRSAASPSQIAGGFILGMIIGLSPTLLTLTNFVLILVIVILNVNIATAIFAMALCSVFAYLLDPFFHSIGYYFLVDSQSLHGMWVGLYNDPVIPFTKFNNTVVLGSLIVAVLLAVPVYFGVKKSIVVYRERYEPKVQNWKWMKVWKGTPFYQWYERLKFLGDKF